MLLFRDFINDFMAVTKSETNNGIKVDLKRYIGLLFSSPTVREMGPARRYVLYQLIYGQNDQLLSRVYATLLDESAQMARIDQKFQKITGEIMDRFGTEVTDLKNARKKNKLRKSQTASVKGDVAEASMILNSLNDLKK